MPLMPLHGTLPAFGAYSAYGAALMSWRDKAVKLESLPHSTDTCSQRSCPLNALGPNRPVRFTRTVNKPLLTCTPGRGSALPTCEPPLGGEPVPWVSHRLNCILHEP